MTAERQQKYKSSKSSLVKSNEIYAQLQDANTDEPIHLTILGEDRLSVISDTRSLVDVLAAAQSLSEKNRTIIELLLSGFEKPVIGSIYDEPTVHVAVQSLRKKIETFEKKRADEILPVLLDFEATADELRYFVADDEWGKFVACTSSDDAVLEIPKGRKGGANNRARLLCHSCLVRLECLKNAIDTKQTRVVRGGLGDSERDKVKAFLYPEIINSEGSSEHESDQPAA